MGRGFTIWEPFIQPTYVLLTLLELCADAELYIPKLVNNYLLFSFIVVVAIFNTLNKCCAE